MASQTCEATTRQIYRLALFLVAVELGLGGASSRRLTGLGGNTPDLWLDQDGGGPDTRDVVDNDSDDGILDTTSVAKRTSHLREVCSFLVAEERAERGSMSLFRPGTSPPCSCTTKFSPVDLGPNRYPRHINAVRCEPGSCWRCHERKYGVAVLKPRPYDGHKKHDPEEGVPKVPETINRDWTFEIVDVPVACECGL